MRGLLACAMLAAMTSAAMTTAASAQVSDDVVRIGVLTDLSSWGRDNSGPGSVEAAKMAVEEFGPTVLGKPIEIISADHQMKTDVGVQIVARLVRQRQGRRRRRHSELRHRDRRAQHGARAQQDRAALRPRRELAHRRAVQPEHRALHLRYLRAVQGDGLRRDQGRRQVLVLHHGRLCLRPAARKGRHRASSTRWAARCSAACKHPTNTADFSSFALQAQSSKADVVGVRQCRPGHRQRHQAVRRVRPGAGRPEAGRPPDVRHRRARDRPEVRAGHLHDHGVLLEHGRGDPRLVEEILRAHQGDADHDPDRRLRLGAALSEGASRPPAPTIRPR